MPSFSFIIPVKPGGKIAALAPLHCLDSAAFPFEVLVAEGCLPGRQRNLAADQATGDIIYFLDDDSMVAGNCLEVCSQAMSQTDVAVVGGPSLTPASDSTLQQLFGSAMASLFGAGGVRNRYRSTGRRRDTTEKELILCNLAMRRELFRIAGGFDERLYPNEENELLDRIKASGYRLVHAPEMAIQRSQRRSLKQFIRQMFSYGRGRAQQTLIAGGGPAVSFVPLVFVVYLLLVILLMPGGCWLLPLYAYLGLALWFAGQAAVTAGKMSRLLLMVIFPLLHVSNGVGLICGLLGGKTGIPRDNGCEVTVRRVKTFEQDVW